MIDVALIIAGDERGFLSNHLWLGYARYVVSPLRINASATVTAFLCLDRASREPLDCPHRRCGRLPPNFCNGYGFRHPLYPT